MEVLYALGGLLFIVYALAYLGICFILPICALFRLSFINRYSSAYAIGLKQYVFSVFFYILISYWLIEHGILSDFNPLFVFYLHVLPWIISIKYIKHTRKWDQSRKNIAEFDKLQLFKKPHNKCNLMEPHPMKIVPIMKTKHCLQNY